MVTFEPIPTAEHVAAAVASARLEEDPFPHLIIDSLLPPESYDRLVKQMPAADAAHWKLQDKDPQ